MDALETTQHSRGKSLWKRAKTGMLLTAVTAVSGGRWPRRVGGRGNVPLFVLSRFSFACKPTANDTATQDTLFSDNHLWIAHKITTTNNVESVRLATSVRQAECLAALFVMLQYDRLNVWPHCLWCFSTTGWMFGRTVCDASVRQAECLAALFVMLQYDRLNVWPHCLWCFSTTGWMFGRTVCDASVRQAECLAALFVMLQYDRLNVWPHCLWCFSTTGWMFGRTVCDASVRQAECLAALFVMLQYDRLNVWHWWCSFLKLVLLLIVVYHCHGE